MDDLTDISYIINELGETGQIIFNAVSPPIANQQFPGYTVEALQQLFADEYSGYLYSRA
jgi:hypothetical protein